ncbi:MAG: transposase [Bacteroidales bacterium]|nr:transposase [Bacteroidales bacterium]
MPRKKRQISPTGVYHVMLRGINRSDIFLSDMDRGKFLKILRTVVSPVETEEGTLPPCCKIHAYCLMDNHIHLLIAEGSEKIASIMKKIGVAYVNYFNKQHLRIGPLFQGRFQSEAVCDVRYFIQLLRYIHFNPIKAQMVESLDQYRWSSWSEYRNENPKMDICAHELPFADLSWNKICKLVQENCHEVIASSAIDHRGMNDKEAQALFLLICGDVPFSEMSKEERRIVISKALSAGVKKIQLARITGVPYSTISYRIE